MGAQKRVGLAVAGLALIAVVLFLALKAPEPDVPGRATRIASTLGWPIAVGSAYDWEPACTWLSDHEVLHFTGDSIRGYQAVLLDTRTGTDSPLPALNPLQRGRIVSASPDGRWVIWQTNRYNPYAPTSVATRTSPAVPMPKSCVGGNWLPDGKHWVFLSCDPQLYRTSQGLAMHPDRVVLESFAAPNTPPVPLPGVFNPLWVLGFTPPQHVLLSTSEKGLVQQYAQSQGIPCLDVDLSAHPPAVRQFTVPLPDQPGAQDVMLTPSPTGDRLLWRFTSHQTSLLTSLSCALHGYAPTSTVTDLWVSRLDGSDARPVCRVNSGRRSPPSAVQWLPGGREISFLYGNVLYTIPAG